MYSKHFKQCIKSVSFICFLRNKLIKEIKKLNFFSSFFFFRLSFFVFLLFLKPEETLYYLEVRDHTILIFKYRNVMLLILKKVYDILLIVEAGYRLQNWCITNLGIRINIILIF